MPSPNQRRNSGASTTRGTAFSILMYGSHTRATSGDRAKPKPSVTPSVAPMISPSSDSSSVVAKCSQSVPAVAQVPTRRAMSAGRVTKKASSPSPDTSACHTASTATPTAICHATTLRALLAFDDFIAKDCPDRAIELNEGRRDAELQEIARAIERDGMDGHDMTRRTGGQDDDVIGERDGLFEVVRDEEHCFSD